MGRKRRSNKHLPERMRLSHGRYYLTRYVDGKQKWIALGKDYASATARYAELEGIDDKGDPEKKFSELADRFEADCYPRYSDNSQRSFRSWVKPLRAVFNPVPISDIRQMDAARYLDESKYQVSANRQISLLSVMLNEAVRWGWIENNPLQHMRKHKEEARRRYLSDEELQLLVDSADFQMARLIRIAYLTALRKKVARFFHLTSSPTNTIQMCLTARWIHIGGACEPSLGSRMLFSTTLEESDS